MRIDDQSEHVRDDPSSKAQEMRLRASVVVAWASVGVTAALWVFCAVVWQLVSRAHVATPGRDSPVLVMEIGIAVMVFGVVGAMIASRRPRHPFGWIFAGSAFLVTFKATTGIWVDYGHFVRYGRLPLWTWSAWISNFVWIPAIGCYATFLLLVFPTGRAPSPRWRAAGWMAAIAIVAAASSVAFARGPLDQFPYVENPLPMPPWTQGVVNILGFGFQLLVLSVVTCVASLVVRWRHSNHIEREQIKWIAFVGVFLAVGFVVDVGLNRFDALTAPLLFGPLAGIAVASVIAIQRYRLFEIDNIISRTLAYALVTALLAGTFALVVLVPMTIVGTGRRPDWLVAAGTLVVAALFRPVRRRVQDVIDHRFNRKRYDAQHTVDVFTARLREQIDIDALEAELSDVVARTMEPRSVSVWLKGGR